MLCRKRKPAHHYLGGPRSNISWRLRGKKKVMGKQKSVLTKPDRDPATSLLRRKKKSSRGEKRWSPWSEKLTRVGGEGGDNLRREAEGASMLTFDLKRVPGKMKTECLQGGREWLRREGC